MLIGQKVVLREKRISDAATDYAWRCDADLARLDAVLPITMPYREFMAYCADELQSTNRWRRRFAIDSLDASKHIGNCMLYDIDEHRRQEALGIMIGEREYWGKGYGTDAVTTLVSHIFKETNIDRIYLNTLEWNVRAQRCFRKCGFIACGRVIKRGNDFIVMELHRSWLKSIEDNATLTPQSADNKTYLPPTT